MNLFTIALIVNRLNNGRKKLLGISSAKLHQANASQKVCRSQDIRYGQA